MEIFQDLEAQFASYYDHIIKLIPRAGVAIVVVTLFLLISRLIRTRSMKYVRSKADDSLLVDFLNRILKIFNVIVAVLLFLYIVGLAGIAGSAMGGLGIGAIVVGFAFKDIAENFLAGVIMAFKRPFRVGDVIESQSIVGSVVDMTLRETHLKTFEGKDVYIPNGQIIKSPLFNYTIDGFIRSDFIVGVGYESDIDEVRKMILDTMMKVDGIIKEGKMPSTTLSQFGKSTVDIKVQYWIDTFDKSYSSSEVRSVAMSQVLKTLEGNKVSMPYEILEIKNID